MTTIVLGESHLLFKKDLKIIYLFSFYADQAITSAPQNVTLSNTTTSSVTVSWQTPRVIVSDVIYYGLCVRGEANRILGRDCQTTIVEPTQLSAVIYGLDACTSYGIRVRAHNLKRPGNYSEESIIKTLGKDWLRIIGLDL